MPTTLLSPGPTYNILQNVIYALPGSACDIVLGTTCQRSNTFGGTYVDWAGGYNHVGGFIRCLSGNTTYKATKLKMKELDQYYSSIVMQDKPSYRWSLDEISGTVAVDSVGGANGTINAGVTVNQAGVLGKSMLFNGSTGGIVSSPFTITLPLVCTIEGWIKPVIDATSHHSMFSCRYIPTGFLVGFMTGNFIACYGDSSIPNSINTTTPISINAWHHIVFIRNGTKVTFYVDGIPTTLSQTHVALTSQIAISDPGNGNPFPGYIDEVAIYPYALTPAQIQSHYIAKSVPPNSYASAVMSSKPTNYWQLDEEGGLSAVDLVGGKHGTISGGVTLNQAGVSGKSMLFNGTSGQIVTAAQTLTPPFSIELWFRATSEPVASVYPTLFLITNGVEVTYDSYIQYNSGSTGIASEAYSAGGASYSAVAINFSPIAGQWYHFVIIIYPLSRLQMYLNGILPSSASDSDFSGGPLSPVTGPLNIGFGGGRSGYHNFPGNLDEVAVYNRALSASEIQSHYLARFGITDPNSYAAKIVMSGPSNYWRLNETSGLTFVDIVGGNTATIGSSTGWTLGVPGVAGSKGVAVNGSNAAQLLVATPFAIGTTVSYEFWVKPLDHIETVALVIGSVSGGPGLYYNQLARLLDLNFAGSHFNNTPLVNGMLHHVVISINAGVTTFYVNGVADGTVSGWTGGTINGFFASGPGVRTMTASLLDEVAIYPRALSAQEILSHYQSR